MNGKGRGELWGWYKRNSRTIGSDFERKAMYSLVESKLEASMKLPRKFQDFQIFPILAMENNKKILRRITTNGLTTTPFYNYLQANGDASCAKYVAGSVVGAGADKALFIANHAY